MSNDTGNFDTTDAIIGELRHQFDREVELRKNLDSKINSLITMVGSIMTLNIAIGTFLISKLQWEDSNYYYFPIFLQVIGIIFSLVSMYFFISKFGIKTYTYPFGHEQFYEGKEYSQKKTNDLKSLPIDKFKDSQIMAYAKSINTSAQINDDRKDGIKWGQRFLAFTLIMISILVISILILIGCGLVSIKMN